MSKDSKQASNSQRGKETRSTGGKPPGPPPAQTSPKGPQGGKGK